MRKVFAVIASLMLVGASAQTDTLKKKNGLDCYVSGFFATSTGNNIKQASYAGVEAGVCLKNFMVGLSTGRGNLYKPAGQSDNINNYWYEVKTYGTMPIGVLKGSIIMGWGQFYKTTQYFIEYGVGLSYSAKAFDFGLCATNWDNAWYVAPEITYNFNVGKK
jgi:hypothetical protein